MKERRVLTMSAVLFLCALSCLTLPDTSLAADGSISGRVTAPGGAGIAGVLVYVYDESYSYIPEVYTDAGGYYSIGNLSTGSYTVEFYGSHLGYINERYDDKGFLDTPDIVQVTDPFSVPNIDAELAPGGTISGKVTTTEGIGIPGVYLYVFDSSYNNYGVGLTDEEGNYRAQGIPTGSYKIQIFATHAGYINEWYSDKADMQSADTVTVTAPEERFDINAVLEAGGTISGRVTSPGGAGIEGATVTLYDTLQAYVTSVLTDADGGYGMLGLPGGGYKVHFNAASQGYSAEWFDDAADFAAAGTVSVTLGLETPGIDAELAVGGSVSGRVTAPGGAGIESVYVSACTDIYSCPSSAASDAEGYYTIVGLPTGTYMIRFYENFQGYINEWYDDAADFADALPVSVTLGEETPAINAELAPGGSISGRVTGTGGVGLGQVLARVHDAVYGTFVANSQTDSEGYYSVRGLRTGTYKVQFEDYVNGYPGEWYNDQPSSFSADVVAVTAPQDTPGIDAELSVAGTISGKVTVPGGSGIGGVWISLYEDGSGTIFKSEYNNADGTYSISGLPTGSYTMHFQGMLGDAKRYVREWYDDKGHKGIADPVFVSDPGETAGIDAELAEGGTISGRVTAVGGAGIEGVSVSVYEHTRNYNAGSTTDAEGYYSVIGLPTGYYQVRFNGFGLGYLSEYYDDRPSTSQISLVVVTAPSEVTDINAELAMEGTVSGRVIAEDGGAGIPDLPVSVCRNPGDCIWSDRTDEEGYYQVGNLPAGNHYVRFAGSDQGYQEEWYNDAPLFDGAVTVPVAAGADTPSIDASLVVPGSISGRVTAPGGAGIENVVVSVSDLDSHGSGSATTDSSGYYRISDIASGSYNVYFRGADVQYRNEWYDDRDSRYTADTVTVTSPFDTAVNAELTPTGTISGVLREDGTTHGWIGYGGVIVYDSTGNSVAQGSANSLGRFTVESVPPGSYRVAFAANGYFAEYYHDKADFDSADPVAVSAFSDTSLGYVDLTRGGSITGSIRGADGAMVYGAIARLYDSSSNLIDADTASYETGRYTFRGLQTGSYKVHFTGNSLYGGEWYSGKDDFDSADPVFVTVGQETSGINAALSFGGEISGRVTASGGAGIPDVWVEVTDLDNLLVDDTQTDGDGYYTLSGIRSGDYKVFFQGVYEGYVDEWYDNKADFDSADPVTVTSGQNTSHIDALLELAGSISGRVTAPGGAGIPNVLVEVSFSGGDVFDYTFTDPDGFYAVEGIPTGSFKVFFLGSDEGYINEWHSNRDTFDTADTVAVTAPQNTVVDAELALGGTISGRITEPGGGGIAVKIELYGVPGGHLLSEGNSVGDGSYVLRGIPTGSYAVVFGVDSTEYAMEWYDDKDDFASADTVAVTAPADTPGIDAELALQDNLWLEAADLGGGWYWLDWFGYFNLAQDPWVFHREHGFLYPFGTSTDSLVFWDSDMSDFWWTSRFQYPYTYRFSDGEWLWYLEGSTGPRWFFNLSDGAWEVW